MADELTVPDDYFIPVRGKAVATIAETAAALGVASPHEAMIRAFIVVRKLLPMMDKNGNVKIVDDSSGIFPPKTITIHVSDFKREELPTA